MTDCAYCQQWNHEHPHEQPRVSCGPCEVCQAPGHVGAHPRLPTSHCLCPKHWEALNAPRFRFDLSHLIVVLVIGVAAAQLFAWLFRLWGP